MPLSVRSFPAVGGTHLQRTKPAARKALPLRVMSVESRLPAAESLVTRWPRESDAGMV